MFFGIIPGRIIFEIGIKKALLKIGITKGRKKIFMFIITVFNYKSTGYHKKI